MHNVCFQFKKFDVCHDRCAMKVGTDGVLLGAWANVQCADSVLDVGTGSGLIALMIAQRNPLCKITGIDIDQSAALQASENFRRSLWQDRLESVCVDFCKYDSPKKFDLIISNPPFYAGGEYWGNVARRRARSEDTLSFENLISSVVRMLHLDGFLP